MGEDFHLHKKFDTPLNPGHCGKERAKLRINLDFGKENDLRLRYR